MKCSKCGYTSFDYNQVCPKCNKDITSERESLNLPSYRPNPPSLLGALTGVFESPESEDIPLSDTETLSDKEEILDVIDDEASLNLEGLDDVFEEKVGDLDFSMEGDGDDSFSLDLESLDLDLELEASDENQS